MELHALVRLHSQILRKPTRIWRSVQGTSDSGTLPLEQHVSRVQIVVIFVVGLLVAGIPVGIIENQQGYQHGVQDNINSSGAAYAGFLQEALGKMADVSHSKSLKAAGDGFDALASAFRFANETSSVFEQYQRLCLNQTSQQSFSRTATLTGNMNVSSTYSNSCNNYGIFVNDSAGNTTLPSDFTKLAFSLMKLDNTISEDP